MSEKRRPNSHQRRAEKLAAQVATLRAALEGIAANTRCDPCQEARRVARAALSATTPGETAPPDAEWNCCYCGIGEGRCLASRESQRKCCPDCTHRRPTTPAREAALERLRALPKFPCSVMAHSGPTSPREAEKPKRWCGNPDCAFGFVDGEGDACPKCGVAFSRAAEPVEREGCDHPANKRAEYYGNWRCDCGATVSAPEMKECKTCGRKGPKADWWCYCSCGAGQ